MAAEVQVRPHLGWVCSEELQDCHRRVIPGLLVERYLTVMGKGEGYSQACLYSRREFSAAFLHVMKKF
ncbi:hypothetical protein GJ688_00190 [Heliobacillus mobilis]|uniref:Uncharacterized protein n=1 Tax=Heliobacterium mobile TaxID=28064 RepID=A0A6I3SFW4_HELMO|nr:hypothetical protein [Heliobacterium mobile]